MTPQKLNPSTKEFYIIDFWEPLNGLPALNEFTAEYFGKPYDALEVGIDTRVVNFTPERFESFIGQLGEENIDLWVSGHQDSYSPYWHEIVAHFISKDILPYGEYVLY